MAKTLKLNLVAPTIEPAKKPVIDLINRQMQTYTPNTRTGDLTTQAALSPETNLTVLYVNRGDPDNLHKVILTASDGSRKSIFGTYRHAYSGVFGLGSPLNFGEVMTGPQNITLAEIAGICHTLVRTTLISNFTNEQEHHHVTDNMNAFNYLKDLQVAARNETESSNVMYTALLCIPQFWTCLSGVIDILRKRTNLHFRWVHSHTDDKSMPSVLNDEADRCANTFLDAYYEQLPPITATDAEKLRFNALPANQRDLF